MILDTDVIIWMLRGHPTALNFARAIAPERRLTSVVSELELLKGCRNQREQRDVETLLHGWFAEVVPLDAKISQRAVSLMRKFQLARGLGTADALIAATALERGVPLATGNLKHFRFVPGLAVQPFKSPRS